MSRMPYHEHDHLRAMIDRMQRDGRPEAAIHEAVRQASDRTHPGRERPGSRSSGQLLLPEDVVVGERT